MRMLSELLDGRSIPSGAHAARLLAAIAALAVLLPTTQASAASPAWSVSATAYPSNFAAGSNGTAAAGPALFVLATNVGAASTSGPVSISVSLPPQLTTAAGVQVRDQRNRPLTCTEEAQAVTCVGEQSIVPGEWVFLRVPVAVAPAASGTLAAAGAIEGGAAGRVTSAVPIAIDPLAAPFGFVSGSAGLFTLASDAEGLAATRAGSHPHQLTVGMHFARITAGATEAGATVRAPGGGVKRVRVDLPAGIVVNPNATPVRCTEAQFLSRSGGFNCPPESQVGTVALPVVVGSGGPTPLTQNLYNLVPPPGEPAALGFDASKAGTFVRLLGGVRTGEDYGLFAEVDDVNAAQAVLGAEVSLWGNPSDASHDRMRGECSGQGESGSCPIERRETALLTQPSACSAGPLRTEAGIASWEAPDALVERETESGDASGGPVGIDGCSLLEFEPTLTLRPDVSQAETPTGVEVNLHVPQSNDFDELATANLKDTKVTLPEGLVVNPAAAGGLDACTLAQIDLEGSEPDNCPEASKVGTVKVDTPLLDHPVPGAVYLASPHDNPFGSLLAIYLAIDDPVSGVVIKLAGKVEADPNTGQLTTTFNENPQLPFEDFTLEFFGGPRASLKTPDSCGSFETKGELSPWSGTPAVATTDSFQVTGGANGRPCINQEAQRPNSPGFSAGTLSPIAGSYSPFVLRLQRQDGEQKLKGLDLTLPPGLSGKLAGMEQCSEAAIAAATSKSGQAELSSPSCPSSSKAGEVLVGAGAGTQPYYVKGNAYLSGPYKGAPLSMAILTPAVAGPFDLGVVVVRAALHVDPKTAQISVKSDPFPTILEGIPLSIRDIRVQMDRPEFTLNPTNCDPLSIQGSSISLLGQSASLSNPFQAQGCKGLEFKPKLSLRLKGKTKRGDNPRLIANLRARPGDANIAKAQVTLPRSAFLDQAHIRTVCTRAQFAVDACPRGSIYGKARAITPLLDYPLAGNVYLRSSDNPLPDLVADLRGPSHQPIRIELVGRTDAVKGALRNTFEAVPDAPVSAFRLELFGGKRGLVVNSQDLCKRSRRATIKLDAQSGVVYDTRPRVSDDCGKKRGRKR